jgi:hypothetical protein
MSIKYVGISTMSNPSPSRIYPNWDFCFENKPSGNPGTDYSREFAEKAKPKRHTEDARKGTAAAQGDQGPML